MIKVDDVIDISSGSPQFRIREALDPEAPVYSYYGQPEIENDLSGIILNLDQSKQIRTWDQVTTADTNEVVFSLISGTATLVSQIHHGYLLTQNYLKFDLKGKFDNRYFAYLLNENKSIQHQLRMGLQGSSVLKYSLKQVKNLEFSNVPSMERQQLIGEVYFDQLKLEALRKRIAMLETTSVLEKLKGNDVNERNKI